MNNYADHPFLTSNENTEITSFDPAVSDKVLPAAKTDEAAVEEELFHSLENAASISRFLTENQAKFRSQSIGELVSDRVKAHNLTKSTVAERAGTSWVYLYQILTDKRHPSRNRILSIGIALGCELDELQTLLRDCGYATLDIRSRRDSIILYGILHGQNMFDINENLFSAGEETLN